MSTPRFSLEVQALQRPTLPSPADVRPSDVRSPLIPSVLAATSPLYISISLLYARDTKNPLHPATHLQLSYDYEGTGEIFIPTVVSPERLTWSGPESNLYEVEVLPRDIPRAKVNHGMTSTATLNVYAWKGGRLLGKWTAGQIEGLGIVGLKSTDLALRRLETWNATRNEATLSG